MSEQTPQKSLPKGTYSPPGPNDLRSPCPFINTLANHGHIPRDGRNLTTAQLQHATQSIGGLSYLLSSMLSYPIFLEHHPALPESDQAPPPPKKSLLARTIEALKTGTFPWSIVLSDFGMRPVGQKNESGTPTLNLDQIALRGKVEHDISLTRLDAAQGDNLSAQPDLIRQLLESSSDGKTLSVADLAEVRKRRIEKQRVDNTELVYGARENRLACGESGLLVGVFGDEKGEGVRVDFARALFEEERLPVEEGWVKRNGGVWWDSVGLKRVGGISKRVRELVGDV